MLLLIDIRQKVHLWSDRGFSNEVWSSYVPQSEEWLKHDMGKLVRLV